MLQDLERCVIRILNAQGDLLSPLAAVLTGGSISTASTAAQLLSKLGTSVAGEAAAIHERVIEALVQALQHPQSQQEVLVLKNDGISVNKGKNLKMPCIQHFCKSQVG